MQPVSAAYAIFSRVCVAANTSLRTADGHSFIIYWILRQCRCLWIPHERLPQRAVRVRRCLVILRFSIRVPPVVGEGLKLAESPPRGSVVLGAEDVL